MPRPPKMAHSAKMEKPDKATAERLLRYIFKSGYTPHFIAVIVSVIISVAAGVAFEKHLPAILVCHARTPEPNLLVHCQREKIALLSTPLDQFSASFRIGQCLLA